MELTPRQIQLILLIAEGLSSEEMSKRLNISRKTVDSHRKTILKNSGCRNWNHYMAQLGRSGRLDLWGKMHELNSSAKQQS